MVRTLYKLELVEKIAKILDEMPAKPKIEKDVTATEAIQKLDKSIRSMQKKNFTLEEIAVILSKNEMKVSVATLKSALARSPAKKAAGSAQTATSGDKPAARQSRPVPASSDAKTAPDAAQENGSFAVKEDRREL